jgi:hypothetical protein
VSQATADYINTRVISTPEEWEGTEDTLPDANWVMPKNAQVDAVNFALISERVSNGAPWVTIAAQHMQPEIHKHTEDVPDEDLDDWSPTADDVDPDTRLALLTQPPPRNQKETVPPAAFITVVPDFMYMLTRNINPFIGTANGCWDPAVVEGDWYPPHGSAQDYAVANLHPPIQLMHVNQYRGVCLPIFPNKMAPVTRIRPTRALAGLIPILPMRFSILYKGKHFLREQVPLAPFTNHKVVLCAKFLSSRCRSCRVHRLCYMLRCRGALTLTEYICAQISHQKCLTSQTPHNK